MNSITINLQSYTNNNKQVQWASIKTVLISIVNSDVVTMPVSAPLIKDTATSTINKTTVRLLEPLWEQ